ncbi:hydrogen peroxide-inducible genes activator [Pseudohaliea rubra]|uniref:Hydrogen peroxide-inducible transcriptional regulator n=1 Tax=Pseudohaliea rubra DSM 19751 TaxID=1265313 RepID=A0A095XZS5_9GAMM|nr:hydrogen peroxide-inducible genes activator [Pseudohaliea rubra]KGE05281.1 Hydrogen peroxide-inducible transcriptional regulator [Pseudohaliea rubra DSM 19751]
MTDRRSASLSLKQLAYLLAVRDTLNFTRAAEQCFVTQSSLSGGLAELERTLGMKLVERSRQHVAMTPAGEAVCGRAEQILSASEDLLAFARAQAEPGTGSLRLGMIPTIAPYLLHEFLAGTAEHFPKLELFLHERQTESLLEQVSGGELDAAVLALPMDTGTLAVTHLFDDPLRLLAAPGHAVAQQRAPLRLSAIDTSQVILLEPGHCLREHTLSACGVGAQASRRFEATNIDTLVQLAEAGCGLALLPAMAVASGVLEGTSLREVRLQAPPHRGIALITRASHPLRAFLEREIAALLTGNR